VAECVAYRDDTWCPCLNSSFDPRLGW